LGVAVAVALGVGDGVAVAVALGVGDGVAVALGVGDGVAVAVALSVGDGVAVAVALGVGDGVLLIAPGDFKTIIASAIDKESAKARRDILTISHLSKYKYDK